MTIERKDCYESEEEMEKVYRIFTVLNNLSRRHANCIQRRFLRIESYRNSQSSPFINSIITKSNSFLPKATLFSLGGLNLLNVSNEEHITRLSRAIKDGNKFEVIRHLKSGLDPNSRHPLGWCPLHVAAINNRPEIIR